MKAPKRKHGYHWFRIAVRETRIDGAIYDESYTIQTDVIRHARVICWMKALEKERDKIQAVEILSIIVVKKWEEPSVTQRKEAD